MPEKGPGGKWIVSHDIKSDPGGSMAIVDREIYRAPCMTHNPGVPVYTRDELEKVKKQPHSADVFRAIQKIKKVFPKARILSSEVVITPEGLI
jgi:hypothetical protein